MGRAGVVSAMVSVLLPFAGVAAAQAPRGIRVSIFGQGASTTADGGQSPTFSEIVTTLAVQPRAKETERFDYALDVRFAGYPSTEGRANRVSIYEASVTGRLRGGTIALRGGQMWLNELGALGSVGGGLAEYRQPWGEKTLRLRAGVFGGAEPRILEAGYAAGIRKVGGYVALDGRGARRHVAGYVNIRNRGLTERSALLFTNFLPLGQKVFVYQAAEYDLAGPAGQGKGGLSYFFANGRVSPVRALELQGTFHRGRSIDARTITEDQLNGRPIPAGALDGLLFESASGRVTVTVRKGIRLFAGYGRDRNNRDDTATGRATFGVYASNLFGSGLDVNVTDSRMERPGRSSYDSWYVSVGRSLPGRLYVTADYSSSLAVVRYTGTNGFLVESRPRTSRYGVRAILHLTRSASLLLSGEHTDDEVYRENRVLSGLTYRF